MAKLTKQEAAVLKRLQEKAEAPDPTPASRALNISIDLGDEKQVERAQRLGLLDMFGDDDDDDGDDDGDDGGDGDGKGGKGGEGDETPKRKGYFS